jgi:hypothetical protein
MTAILALPRLGTVVMFCTTDATPSTTGGFAVQNTTTRPIVVSGFGPLQPGERTFGGEGHMSGATAEATTFQVTSRFEDPDRIATVTVSGLVDGNVCRGHAHALVQP